MKNIVFTIGSIHLLINLVYAHESKNYHSDHRSKRAKYESKPLPALRPEYSDAMEDKSSLELPVHSKEYPKNPSKIVKNSHRKDIKENSDYGISKLLSLIPSELIRFSRPESILEDLLIPYAYKIRELSGLDPFESDDQNKIDYDEDLIQNSKNQNEIINDELEDEYLELNEMIDNADSGRKILQNRPSNYRKLNIQALNTRSMDSSDIRERIIPYLNKCSKGIDRRCQQIRNVIYPSIFGDSNDLYIIYSKYCQADEYQNYSLIKKKPISQIHYRIYDRRHLEQIFELRKSVVPMLKTCNKAIIKFCGSIRNFIAQNSEEDNFMPEHIDILRFYKKSCRIFDDLSDIISSIDTSNVIDQV